LLFGGSAYQPGGYYNRVNDLKSPKLVEIFVEALPMTYVPSVCVFFKPLSDAVPFALFEEMEQNVPGSFFRAPHLAESAQAGALNLKGPVSDFLCLQGQNLFIQKDH
jgi:hypothetical protein